MGLDSRRSRDAPGLLGAAMMWPFVLAGVIVALAVVVVAGASVVGWIGDDKE